jgi:hypothetical protein
MNFTTYCTFALMALSLCLLVLAWQVNVSYITMFCAGSGGNSLFPVGRGGGGGGGGGGKDSKISTTACRNMFLSVLEPNPYRAPNMRKTAHENKAIGKKCSKINCTKQFNKWRSVFDSKKTKSVLIKDWTLHVLKAMDMGDLYHKMVNSKICTVSVSSAVLHSFILF